ncbi:hypothetical protein [Desulfoluna spongiiphila]|uniref:hypothetical protein n=1 Tax=Desulfoluna spongiiphila TaxID=419481 RepID=UPI0012525FD0|nr:hypothetical protein [Desulfoluna spongiiphila]VVS94248.1 prokaryotic membrane lipoprotein lipid attachment site profile [Desulfoluna spongiiphila]
MKLRSIKKSRIASTFIALCAIALTGTQATASCMDAMFGRVAHEGTELHELAMTSLNQNGGADTYFTNGEGRVLDVKAKQFDDGRVRVSVERVYIPRNYITGTHDGTLAVEATYDRLHELAQTGDKLGGYTLLPNSVGADAFQCGTDIAMALDSE